MLERRLRTGLRGRESGQTLVEFGLLLPVLLMMLMGVFDLGRVVLANDMLSNAAREAARSRAQSRPVLVCRQRCHQTQARRSRGCQAGLA